jgi:glucose/arabinose dehydrogenase/plastocyanin
MAADSGFNSPTRRKFGWALVVGLFATLGVFRASSASVNIDINGFSFDPDPVTIQVNDQVIWTWQSNFHSTTSQQPGLWDSMVQNQPFTFTNTFTTEGSFPYLCTFHGFTGTINVQGAASGGPSVSITSPADGATFTDPATVIITADASDSGSGTITNVLFLDGTTTLTNDTTAPYSAGVPLAIGPHALSAIAMDDAGLSATSSVVNVTVNAGAPTINVVITNPTNNAVLPSSAATLMQATAVPTNGAITNVQFFDGTNLVGNRISSPFNVSATLSIGIHALTAVAFSDAGVSATSAPVIFTTARYLPAITNGNITLLLQPVATNLSAPDYAISPPGDRTRLFVIEQNGLLRVIENGVLSPTPALNIQSRVAPPLVPTNPNDERGFLGLAFHPGYTNPASPGYRTLYTYNSEMIPQGTLPTYPVPTTATNNYRNVVNEWKISTTNASVVDPNSRREVISFGKTAGNHNGGTVAFGPDGYMYLALGDGGDANDVGPSHIEPGGNAQNLSTPLGKFLRFDPLDPALTPGSSDAVSSNGQYRIPASNPFTGPGQLREIYAYGMRNPYRFSFDPVTGDLIHADVGQNNVEEIDRIVIGGNYGWAIKEGDFLFNRTNGPAGAAGTIGAPPGNRSPGVPAGLIDPISGTMGTLEYDHNEGISITGGFVYRGTAIPELYGKYIFGDLALKTAPVRADGRIFFADLQAGVIKAFPWYQFGGSAVLPNGLTVHGFGRDADGEIYALVTNTSSSGNGGIVYKIVPLRLTIQTAGGNATVSWPTPAGHLQVQSNPPGTGIGPNWVDVPGTTGTNQLSVPISPNPGNVFYRLSVP